MMLRSAGRRMLLHGRNTIMWLGHAENIMIERTIAVGERVKVFAALEQSKQKPEGSLGKHELKAKRNVELIRMASIALGYRVRTEGIHEAVQSASRATVEEIRNKGKCARISRGLE